MNTVINDWCAKNGVQLTTAYLEGYLHGYIKLTMTLGVYQENMMLRSIDFDTDPLHFLEHMLNELIVRTFIRRY